MTKIRICTECGRRIKFPDRRRGGRNMALHYQKHHRTVVTPGMIRMAEIVREILKSTGGEIQ